jgi:hypothetical protein
LHVGDRSRRGFDAPARAVCSDANCGLGVHGHDALPRARSRAASGGRCKAAKLRNILFRDSFSTGVLASAPVPTITLWFSNPRTFFAILRHLTSHIHWCSEFSALSRHGERLYRTRSHAHRTPLLLDLVQYTRGAPVARPHGLVWRVRSSDVHAHANERGRTAPVKSHYGATLDQRHLYVTGYGQAEKKGQARPSRFGLSLFGGAKQV